MSTMIVRCFVTFCVFMAAKVAGESSDNEQFLFYTESKELLKKRIIEEEILLKFLNQLSKISRVSNRKFAQSDSAAKRIGSEFVGKRGGILPAEVTQDDAPSVAMLASHLLNFDTSVSKKRLGSEFLGKRGAVGSEFVGERSFDGQHGVTSDDDELNTEASDEKSRFHSNK